MTAKDCQLFDFRKAGYVDESLLRQLRQWSAKTARIFSERWADLAPTDLDSRVPTTASQSFSTFLDSQSEFAIGWPLTIENFKLNTLLLISNADLLTLVGQILCESREEKPEPRDLTSVELEIGQLIIETFCASMSEAWPQKESLQYDLSPFEVQPQRSRMYLGTEFMIVLNFPVQSPVGEIVLQWAFPRALTAKALEAFVEVNPGTVSHNPREVVQNIPVEMVVVLGSVKLSMQELTQLSEGDIVRLNQRIDEPILGLIDDEAIFKGWPGRLGVDRVFKINRIIN
ncbi:MAG: FliM/FliN family flagellar motor switch protein [Pirellulaceae bacterium]